MKSLIHVAFSIALAEQILCVPAPVPSGEHPDYHHELQHDWCGDYYNSPSVTYSSVNQGHTSNTNDCVSQHCTNDASTSNDGVQSPVRIAENWDLNIDNVMADLDSTTNEHHDKVSTTASLSISEPHMRFINLQGKVCTISEEDRDLIIVKWASLPFEISSDAVKLAEAVEGIRINGVDFRTMSMAMIDYMNENRNYFNQGFIDTFKHRREAINRSIKDIEKMKSNPSNGRTVQTYNDAIRRMLEHNVDLNAPVKELELATRDLHSKIGQLVKKKRRLYSED